MTIATSPNPSPSLARHKARLTRWGGWLGFLLLAGHLLFCHGCHGDEDNELCAPLREKPEIRNSTSSISRDAQRSAILSRSAARRG